MIAGGGKTSSIMFQAVLAELLKRFTPIFDTSGRNLWNSISRCSQFLNLVSDSDAGHFVVADAMLGGFGIPARMSKSGLSAIRAISMSCRMITPSKFKYGLNDEP